MPRSNFHDFILICFATKKMNIKYFFPRTIYRNFSFDILAHINRAVHNEIEIVDGHKVDANKIQNSIVIIIIRTWRHRIGNHHGKLLPFLFWGEGGVSKKYRLLVAAKAFIFYCIYMYKGYSQRNDANDTQKNHFCTTHVLLCESKKCSVMKQLFF